MRPSSLSKKVVVPAAVAVVATGAIAFAAIPSANGTINGCYSTNALTKGNLRIIDEGQTCRSGEVAISWNQKGQKGDKGDLGATGAAGVAGPIGPAGAIGAAGAKGDAGAAGAAGAKGDKGDTGAAGADGAAGLDGTAGAAGRDGRDGKDGAQGATGPKGDTGATGPAGPQGPAGPAGPSGAAAALVLGGEALQGGTADAFLKLDKPPAGGFPNSFGESTVRGHEGEIELSSFNFSIENLISIGSASGGAGAGKAKFGTFHFTKFFDSATPWLLKAAASGVHFPTATVTFRKRGAQGAAADFLKIRFKLAFVSKWEQGGKAEPPLLENVDFAVGAFAVEYRQQDPDGTLGDPKTFGWDQTKNQEDGF